MCFKVSFWKRFFRLIIAIAVAVCFTPLVALAVTEFTANPTTITTDNDDQPGHRFGGSNLTFEVNSGITYNRQGQNAISVFKNGTDTSGATIIINSGATLSAGYKLGAAKKNAINAEKGVNVTITNSGTISAASSVAIKLHDISTVQITNNAGGSIFATSQTIFGDSDTTNATITNSGDIYVSGSGNAIDFDTVSGATITNSAGGKIYNQAGVGAVVYLGSSSTLTNSGTIQHTEYATTNYWSIRTK